MKTTLKIAAIVAIAAATFLIASKAQAQVFNNYWKLLSGTLQPVVSSYDFKIPSLGGGGTLCVQVDNNGLFSTAADACGTGSSGGGADGNWVFYNNSGIRLATTSNQVVVGATATTSLAKLSVFQNGTNPAAYFLGNVGIGTTSPYAALSVVGQVVGAYFTATTSTASTFPYASTTAISTSALFVGSDYVTDFGNGLSISGAGVVTATLGTTISAAELANEDWGDITISAGVASVEDDSHAHTGTTLSGIDISDDTNLTAGDGLTLTDDDLDCDTASGSTFGCLSSTDWTTFNNKQASGNYITALTGDVTASGPGSVAATLATVNSNVGSFTNANVTVNAKGLVTAVSSGSAGGGTGNVATSSAETAGQLPYWTSTSGTPATLGGVATTSVTCTGNATCDAFTVIGASPITINASGGSGVGLSTSTPIVDTYVIYGTSASTVGAEEAFNYDDATNRLTVDYASTTMVSATTASTTNLTASSLTSALTQTGADGTFAEYAGTSCTNQFIRSLSALGIATCATVATTDISSGSTNTVLVTNGLDAVAWEKLSLSSQVQGTLAVGNGGTGATTLTGLLQGNGTGAITGGATINNGNWSGTDLSVENGGSGASTLTGILLGNGTSAFTGLTTSAGIFGAISDETGGSGVLVGSAGPTFTGLATFANSTTSLASFTYASSTDLLVGRTLKIPVGTAPTFNAQAQIGWDTTSGNLRIATSTSGATIVGASATTTLYSFAVASTSADFISGGVIELPAHFLPQVVTGIICKADSGTSVVINLSSIAGSSDTNTVTCTTTSAQYAITSNQSFAAYAAPRLEVGTITGTVDRLSIRVLGYRTSD